MFLLKSLVIATSLFAIVSGIQPQSASVRGTDTNMAYIQAARDISEKTTLQNALAETLQGTGVSGGAVSLTQTCETVARDFHISKGTQLPQALDALVAADGKHSWSVEKGAVVLIPAGGLPALLKTKIEEVRIQDKNNLTLAVTELLQVRAVRDAISSLRLKPLSPQIGFQKLNRSNSKPEEEPLVVRDISLAEALNSLALEHGGAVWSYVEADCGGQRTVRIDFISQ
ncbi:MAG TPA: hypothetical protein VGJ30_01505 [Candidatus Angelobacter sp.]|jgi:hypothetical protein